MNKLAILSVLFAVVAVAAANPINLEDSEEFSELQLVPDDDGEVAYLSEENQIFADFCKTARDEIFFFIKEKNKGPMVNVFTTFFANINEVTVQLEEIQKAEAEKATKAIQEGAAPEAGQQQSAGLVKSVGVALKSYATAIANATMKELTSRMALLKKTVTDTDNIEKLVINGCSGIQDQLHPKLQTLFQEAKDEIAASSPAAETKAVLEKVNDYQKVGCLTAGRSTKVLNVCNFLKAPVPMFWNLMG